MTRRTVPALAIAAVVVALQAVRLTESYHTRRITHANDVSTLYL